MGVATALFYFYMVAAWGGYVFITNMIPLHALVLLLMGGFSSRLYVSYSSFYALGTLASMQVPFVGFQPVRTSEHMAALGVFGLLQLVAFVELVRSHVPSKQFKLLLVGFVIVVAALAFGALIALTYAGYVAPFTGRFYSLWDTAYAKKHIPSSPRSRNTSPRLAGVLLRSGDAHLPLPRRRVFAVQGAEGRARVCDHLRGDGELLCGSDGEADADADARGLRQCSDCDEHAVADVSRSEGAYSCAR